MDAIALRLSKRLQVGGTPQSFGKDVVSTELLELIAPQCEAKFEGMLSPYYQVPLILSEAQAIAIAASIVEKMILSEVLPVHILPETGQEGGLRKIMAQEWQKELKDVQTGLVKLPGEKIASNAALGFPYSNGMKVIKRGGTNPGRAESIAW